jgi:hypothetical protein
VGLILGVVGLMQDDRKKALAGWGVGLNGLFFFGILIGLLCSMG